MPRRVFTPSIIEAVREMASEQKTAAEIARAIGSTAASVRVKCCHLKIQLSRRGRPSLVPSWPREHRLVICLRPIALCATAPGHQLSYPVPRGTAPTRRSPPPPALQSLARIGARTTEPL